MKLSIIIPAYNAEPWITRCLDSVHASKDVEVIVIDDASTDGTGGLCDIYDDDFTIIHHETNWGTSMARNHGLSIAQGDYVTFLDADDYYMTGAIEGMLAAIETHPDNDIIQFNHSRPHFYNPEGIYQLGHLPKKWVLCWNKAYKRSFLNDHCIRFPEGVSFEEDRAFNLMCFYHCNTIYHAKYCTVQKCFDNKNSICHTVTQQKIIASSEAMTDILKTQGGPYADAVRRITRRCLAELWECTNAKTVFGS